MNTNISTGGPSGRPRAGAVPAEARAAIIAAAARISARAFDAQDNPALSQAGHDALDERGCRAAEVVFRHIAWGRAATPVEARAWGATGLDSWLADLEQARQDGHLNEAWDAEVIKAAAEAVGLDADSDEKARHIDGAYYVCRGLEGKHYIRIGQREIDSSDDLEEGLAVSVDCDDGKHISGGHLLEIRPQIDDDFELVVTGGISRRVS